MLTDVLTHINRQKKIHIKDLEFIQNHTSVV